MKNPTITGLKEAVRHARSMVQTDMSEEDIERAEYVILCARIGIANGLRTKRGKHLFGERAEVKARLKHGEIEILTDSGTYVIRFT